MLEWEVVANPRRAVPEHPKIDLYEAIGNLMAGLAAIEGEMLGKEEEGRNRRQYKRRVS